jgi:hypothetical protein
MENKVTDLLQARKRKVYTKIVYRCSGGSLPLLEKPMFLKEKDLVVFSERTMA